MKGLTNFDQSILIGKIKSFLGITWHDEETELEVADMVTSGVSYINKTAGIELDYFKTPRTISADESTQSLFEDMCHEGGELLKNRCFYYREKALDDFEKNYRTSLNDLFLNGAIFKRKVSND